MCTGLGAVCGILTAAIYMIGVDRGLEYDGSVTIGNFIAVEGLWTPFQRQVVFNNHPMFSFLEHLLYLAGARSERSLLVLPVLAGAFGVALVAWRVARSFGVVAGAAAAFLLAVHPEYAELSRQVRGYSLLAACLIAATILLEQIPTRRYFSGQSIAYVVLMALAIGTHLYAALGFVAHAALVLLGSGLSRAWLARWACAALLGLAPYAAIADEMVESSRARPKTFRPEFPVEVASTLLSNRPVTMIALSFLIAAGLRRVASRQLAAAAGAVVLSLAVVWVVVKPYDLYPRFLVPFAAAVAAVAAVGTTRLPRSIAAALVMLATVPSLDRAITTWTTPATPFAAAAGIAQHAIERGTPPCVGFYYPEAFVGYGLFLPSASAPEHLPGCAVLVLVDGGPDTLTALADETYAHSRRVHGWEGTITIYAHDETLLSSRRPEIPQHPIVH